MMTLCSSSIVLIIEFIGVWALFRRFGQIGGWRLGDVALFYGLVSVIFAIADAVTRGFDVFGPNFVKTGDFDRLLLRPRSPALQLLGYELRLTRIGRFAQGALVFAIGAALTGFHWSFGVIAILGFAILGGVALFSGLLVLQATLAFWTVESLEVAGRADVYGGGGGGGVFDERLRRLVPQLPDLRRADRLRNLPADAGGDGRPDPLGAGSGLARYASCWIQVPLLFLLFISRFGIRRYSSAAGREVRLDQGVGVHTSWTCGGERRMSFAARLEREWIFLRGLIRTLMRVNSISSTSPNLVTDDIEAAVERWREREALSFDGWALTYGEMDAVANRYAHWSENAGIRRGEVVALLMPNRLEYLPIWYGLSKVGVAAALINNQLTGDALAHCLIVPTPPMAWSTPRDRAGGRRLRRDDVFPPTPPTNGRSARTPAAISVI